MEEALLDVVEAVRAFPGFTDDATIGDPWVERVQAAVAKAAEL
jgi:hypothetical protein